MQSLYGGFAVITKNNAKLWGLCLCILFLFLESGLKIKIQEDNILHLFEIYYYEIGCIVIAAVTLARILRTKIWAKKYIIYIIFYLTVILNFITLFLIRVLFGGNYGDSIWLFRNLFCGLSLSLFIVTSSSFISRQKYNHYFVVASSILSAGYLFSVLKEKAFNPNFPNYAITFYTLGLMALPYLVSLITRSKLKGIDLYLANFCIWLILTVSFLSGSRSVFTITVFMTAILLVMAIKKLKRLAAIFIALLSVLILYTGNVYMCRDSIHRSMGIQVTAEEIREPEKAIEKAMQQREEIVSQGAEQNIEYHNPVSHSNAVRVVLLRDAMQELRGDWLFHLKGKTVLEFRQGGEVVLSGTHNFIVDYILAFGLFVTIPIALYVCSIIIAALRPIHIFANKNTVYFLLMVFPVFVIGMVQAILTDRIIIGVFFVHISSIYRLKMEEKENETGFIKKGNDLHYGSIWATD